MCWFESDVSCALFGGIREPTFSVKWLGWKQPHYRSLVRASGAYRPHAPEIVSHSNYHSVGSVAPAKRAVFFCINAGCPSNHSQPHMA